jgi:hypothetical protein
LYRNSDDKRSVDVQFFCEVTDPDSDEHNFLWLFGDDSTSTQQHPTHSFIAEDDHLYTIYVQATDDTGRLGFSTCSISVDTGPSTFPLRLNFVGDIMLARGYEGGGGIIPTLGVEAIFEPTLSILGDNADITVANLECPLTNHNVHHPTKTIYFKGAPENAAGFANCATKETPQQLSNEGKCFKDDPMWGGAGDQNSNDQFTMFSDFVVAKIQKNNVVSR